METIALSYAPAKLGGPGVGVFRHVPVLTAFRWNPYFIPMLPYRRYANVQSTCDNAISKLAKKRGINVVFPI